MKLKRKSKYETLLSKVDELSKSIDILKEQLEYFTFIDKFKSRCRVRIDNTYLTYGCVNSKFYFEFAFDIGVVKKIFMTELLSSYDESWLRGCSDEDWIKGQGNEFFNSNKTISIKCVDDDKRRYKVTIKDTSYLIDCIYKTCREIHPEDIFYTLN